MEEMRQLKASALRTQPPDWTQEQVAQALREFVRHGAKVAALIAHLRDIRAMLAVTDLDQSFFEREIAQRGLGDLLAEMSLIF